MPQQRKLRIRPRGIVAAVVLGIVVVAGIAMGIGALTPAKPVTTRVSTASTPSPTSTPTSSSPSPTPAPTTATASPASPPPAPKPTPTPKPSPAPTPAPKAVAAQPAAAPPYPVAHDTISLADPSRDTPARGSIPAHAGRTLLTVIRRPVGAPGPLPLVVFGHGWNSNPTVYEPLLDEWAAAGYLVAAPTFPSSANTLPGTPVNDYPDQARDLSFVVTSLLGGSAGPVNPARIAIAGHSDGGTDVAYLALNPAYADHRVRAYLSLSSEIPAGDPGPWGAPTAGALLVAVGTNDEYGLASKSPQVFNTASVTSKVMLTVTGGSHIGIYVGSTPQAIALRQETTRFLDVTLRAGGATSAQLASALTPTGNSSILVTAGPH